LIGGGQFREYSDRWKLFVTTLEDAGIHPVFVTDGPTPHSKRETWIKRRYSSATDFVFPVMAAFTFTKNPNTESFRSTVLPSLETERTLRFDVDGELEIINSTGEHDADQLIVQLAIERDAFAIFAQDTDYLIFQYPKNIHYLSSLHFDWNGLFSGSKELKTKTYNRFEVARFLGISVSHFPLLAVLKGNDLVKTDDLKRFHNWINQNGESKSRNYNHAVIENIANFIIYENLPNGQSIFNEINNLTNFVFYGDLNNQKYLEQSLQSYFLMITNPFKHEICEVVYLIKNALTIWKIFIYYKICYILNYCMIVISALTFPILIDPIMKSF
jgi:hypothetical protein